MLTLYFNPTIANINHRNHYLPLALQNILKINLYFQYNLCLHFDSCPFYKTIYKSYNFVIINKEWELYLNVSILSVL